MSQDFNQISNFIWSVADLLRDHYKRSKYADVILPFTVLRRIDCVLTPTKAEVLDKHEQYKDKLEDLSSLLKSTSGFNFYNTSKYDFEKLLDDPGNVKQNITDYINGFSPNIQEIIDKFKLREQITYLDEKDLLYKVVQRFEEIKLSPDNLSNHDMGYVFEELIRKFNEQSNENPGEHFTPREIIKLMVNLLMAKDAKELSKPGKIITVYDPACGTGGMLTSAKEHLLKDINPDANVELFGQEINDETFAVCKSDMLIKGENADNIKYGSSFSRDGLPEMTFDYILSNPPYGKDWKQDAEFIKDEYSKGTSGRFHVGLPRVSDGQLLFLQHMVSKMHKNDEITRIAIVFNGSPLFTGDAGSGESEIRRWIIENDWLDTIVALPNQLFYNTGINTYIWVLTNFKEVERKGKITLINAIDMYVKMKKGLGDKRQEISPEQIQEITEMYLENVENGRVKVFNGFEFGYRKIAIERPLHMSFKITMDRIEKLKEESAFKNLAKSKKRDENEKKSEIKKGKENQQNLINSLKEMGEFQFKDYNSFNNRVKILFNKNGLKTTTGLLRAFRNVFGERNESSDPIVIKNKVESDSELREYESVPLTTNVYDYFENEIKPNVPDAWLDKKFTDSRDGKLGKVGYEININRQFYQYNPPRDVREIDLEIESLQNEIMDLLEISKNNKGF